VQEGLRWMAGPSVAVDLDSMGGGKRLQLLGYLLEVRLGRFFLLLGALGDC